VTEHERSVPTLLILAASPLDQDRLSLNREVKKIKEALKRSKSRENWTIESNEAATVEDLRRALLEFKPTVLHFSGHGGGEGGLCFENDEGETHQTHAAPLAKLLHHFKDTLKCVVLNACYSSVQAELIRQQIDYVVGMSKGIGDEAACKFGVAFYDAVFVGADFRLAFDLACSAIDLSNLSDTDAPVFMTSPQKGGTSLAYIDSIPDVESLIHTYLNTPFQGREQFTTKGDALKDTMCKFYGEEMQVAVGKVTVISMQPVIKDYWKTHVRIRNAKGEGYRDYYVRILGRDVKLDWEASVGYWSMPVKTYLACGTDESIVARVIAELDNAYYGWARDRVRNVQSVSLRDKEGLHLNGYVIRHQPAHKEIMEILSDGKPHNITVTLYNQNDDTGYPVIEEVLSRSWILLDDPIRSDGGEVEAT